MTGLLFSFWAAVSHMLREELVDGWAFSIQRRTSFKEILFTSWRNSLRVRWVSCEITEERMNSQLEVIFFSTFHASLLQFSSLTDVRPFTVFSESKRRQRKDMLSFFS